MSKRLRISAVPLLVFARACPTPWMFEFGPTRRPPGEPRKFPGSSAFLLKTAPRQLSRQPKWTPRWPR
eukprot:3392254-Pyramimonas_sp.AAC.1